MATKIAVPVMMSADLEDALATFAQDNDMSKSEAARIAIAQYLGYDLAAEPATERRRKYATAEERQAAQRERAKERRHEDARKITNARRLAEAMSNGASPEELQALMDQMRGLNG